MLLIRRIQVNQWSLGFSTLETNFHDYRELIILERKVMYTSSYKSIGGDGRGGKAGDGCHYCSHSNDQTGESCGRKHIMTFTNLLTEKNVQHC